MAEENKGSSSGARPTMARRSLDGSPPLEAYMSDDGDMPPAVLAEPEVDAVCALLARVSMRLLQERALGGKRLRLVK